MPHMPYALFPEPGTFHIACIVADQVIAVPGYNTTRAVATGWENLPEQRWFIQRSGRGYKIKNCKYEVYLAAPSGQIGTVVGTSPTPTIWTMVRSHNGFAIQYGEEDSVIDLQHGTSSPDRLLLLWKSETCPDARRWRFERMSDETGEEEADSIGEEITRLRNELAQKNEQLESKDREIADKNHQLAEQASSVFRHKSLNETNEALVKLKEKVDGITERLDEVERRRPNNSG